MIAEPPPTSGNAAETVPDPDLVGPGVPAEDAGTEQCGACHRALPREKKRGQPQLFCAKEHTQWRVPDRHKGGTKLVPCREVAAAWQLEEDTRGRADAPGPPIDLHGLGEQVAAFRTAAADLQSPAQALAERAEQIQAALAGDVAATRREAEASRAHAREMQGKAEVAEAKAAEAKRDAEAARKQAAAEAAAAAESQRLATEATSKRDEALGELQAERERRADAEERQIAALNAKDLAEGENTRLATTVTQLQQQVDDLQEAAAATAREHREEIGRLHQQHTSALATAQADHDRKLTQGIDQERDRFDQELQRVSDEHVAERDRLVAEHAAERDRLTGEVTTVRAAAADAASTHADAIGRLNRELGAATAQAAAAEGARQAAITALTGLRARLADLVADPPENLADQLAQLLHSQEGDSTR